MTADEKSIKDTIRDFVLGSIPGARLEDDANLFESGFANSLFAVQLMTFIERRFAVQMCRDDLNIENFKSLNAVAAFVLHKRRERVA